MAPAAKGHLAVSLLLLLTWLGQHATPARAEDTCYSRSKGFESCWNGCCGPNLDQECCSATYFIVGVSLAAGTVVTIVVVLVLCWVCKDDCSPDKGCCYDWCCCCCGGGGEGGEGREGPGHSRGSGVSSGGRGDVDRGDYYRYHHYHDGRRGGRRGVMVVRPVEPPDYDIVTQMRPPSVMPGYAFRNHPASPPPAYTENVTPPSPPPTPSLAPPSASQRRSNPAQLSTRRHAHTTSLGPGGASVLAPTEDSPRPLSVADVGQPTLRGFTAQPGSRSGSARGGSRAAQVLERLSESRETNRQNSFNANQMFVVQPAADGDANSSSGGRQNPSTSPYEYGAQSRHFRDDDYV